MKQRKTALVLSGGGARGAYETGAWQALIELGIKIDMVAGVSVGAINAAMVVQGDVVKTSNLWRQMETDMIFDVDNDAQLPDYALEFIKRRGASSSGLQNLLKTYVDEEAVRNSSMDMGLLTVQFPTLKPHYLWINDIPEGKLHDYIVASASAYPAIHTHEIDGKEFIDGGYVDVLPVSMATKRGATEIIAVYLRAIGNYHPDEIKETENLTLIESKWDLGNFLVFTKENSQRIMRLGYLDTMKTYDVFDGEYYTFVKGAFDKRTLKQADAAARVFELDPLVIYRKSSFAEALEEAVREARDQLITEPEISLTTVKEFLKLANHKTMTLLIADNIRAKGTDSIFLSRYAVKMLRTEIDAARILVKMGL